MIRKRTTRAIIIAMITLFAAAVAAQPRRGDINDDGAVNQTDSNLLVNHLIGVDSVPEDYNDPANANSDLAVDVADLTWITNYMHPPEDIFITGVSWNYLSPYLLDFFFSVRDTENHAVIVHPNTFDVIPWESGVPISTIETAFYMVRGANKQIRSFLVLDYTDSMANVLVNGDSDGDGKSDAIEEMEIAAKEFIDALNEDAQAGIYEFHREDWDPATTGRVSGFINDRDYLKARIDAIWDDFVGGFTASSRAWDALYAAIGEFGAGYTTDEVRVIVFLSDGKDESSTHRPEAIISLAQALDVQIYCIGFGADVDTEVLQDIADSTGGQLYTVEDPQDLHVQFEQIIRDLGGQYILRWATLKRSTTAFTPSFELRWDPVSAEYSAPPCTPSQTAGDVLRGTLRIPDYQINRDNRSASVFLRASYVPRHINALNLFFDSPYDFTVSQVGLESGGLTARWFDPVVGYDEGTGGHWILLHNNGSPANEITYGAFGPILRFDFHNLPIDVGDELFEMIKIDNSIYLGGQHFELEDWTAPPPSEIQVSPSVVTLSESNTFEWVTVQNVGGLQLTWTADWTDPGITVSPVSAEGNTVSARITATDFSSQRVVPVTFRNFDHPEDYVEISVEVRGSAATNAPTGSFEMGDPWSEGGADELPVHMVDLSAFNIALFEVTNDQYAQYLTNADSHGEIQVISGVVYLPGNFTQPLFYTNSAYPYSQIGFNGSAFYPGFRDGQSMADHPAVAVTWYGAAAYCNWLSRQEGLNEVYAQSGTWASDLSQNGYHLPTEAQWERAAAWDNGHGHWRYGFTSDSISVTSATFADSNPVELENPPRTSPVGYYNGTGGVPLVRSAIGCYDMSGNVAEWCNDWYSTTYYGSSEAVNPTGPVTGTMRVRRGGAWNDTAPSVRSANREGNPPANYNAIIGFRVSRSQ